MSTFAIVYAIVGLGTSALGVAVGIRMMRRWRRDIERQIDQNAWAARSSGLAAQRRGREQAER